MQQVERFQTRWGLILAALGMAIGTGNIWRFPRMIAANGGGAFLIPWLFFLILWSIPLLMVEMVVGKRTRRGLIGAFAQWVGPAYGWMGAFVAWCTLAIMFYYSVVTGWCLRYLVAALMGQFRTTSGEVFWHAFIHDPIQVVLYHLVAMGVGTWIVARGVAAGIERANRIFIPALFAVLVVSAVRALTLSGADAGLAYYFTPNWHMLRDYRVWLNALSQSAWSTGAGWGLLLTYAVYARRREDAVHQSLVIGFGNNSASLLAGLVILPTVFALSTLPYAQTVARLQAPGPASTGVTFTALPDLFMRMPGGTWFSVLFFLGLCFAAISSLIAMIELGVRVLIDFGMSRRLATWTVGLVGFFLGLPSALSLTFFENQDWVWGLGLIVSGAFFTFGVIRTGVDRFRREWLLSETSRYRPGRWLNLVYAIIIPVQFLTLIGWWFYQSATSFARANPWSPFTPFGIGTCLVQWGIVLVVLIGCNRWMVRRVSGG